MPIWAAGSESFISRKFVFWARLKFSEPAAQKTLYDTLIFWAVSHHKTSFILYRNALTHKGQGNASTECAM